MPSEKDLLKEIRENYEYAVNAWKEIREEARIDRRYIAGDPWPDSEKALRQTKDQERPMVAFDELNQYVNQLVNSVRMNKRGVKVIPDGSGATDKTAEDRGNIIRRIEYKSKAPVAYALALQHCAEGSYGFTIVGKRWNNPTSWKQELYIRAVTNPDAILIDPDTKKLDYSDMKFAFELDSVRRKEFKTEWPKAKIVDFSPDMIAMAPDWIRDDKIQIAGYWRLSEKMENLLWIDDGSPDGLAILERDISDDALKFAKDRGRIKAERETPIPTVKRYVTNGVEILEATPWDGTTIPIAPCFGKQMIVDTGAGEQRIILSLVRLARDPYMSYCYARTTQLELAGMSPKSTYMMYEGQVENHEDEWKTAARSPRPYMLVKATTEDTGAAILPLPVRINYEPPIQALELYAEACRRGVQAAMGTSPLPTSAQRQNEKSGVALERIQTQQAQGSYHFIDAYDQMIERVGDICNELLDPVYKNSHEIGATKPDDTHEMIRVNDAEYRHPKTGTPATDLSLGEHDVTISTAENFDSQRQEANQTADLLLQNGLFAPRIGWLAVKLKNLGPLGDEISKLIMPPDVAQEQAGQVPIPPQAKAVLAQAQQHLQALQLYAQKLEGEVKKLSDEREKALLDSWTKIRVALIGSRSVILTALAKEEGANARAALDAHLSLIDSAINATQPDEENTPPPASAPSPSPAPAAPLDNTTSGAP